MDLRCLSHTLRLEALKMAITYVTTTYNVSWYQHLHTKFADATASYIKDDAECELNCKPLGMKYFATLNETVIDGTACSRPANVIAKKITAEKQFALKELVRPCIPPA